MARYSSGLWFAPSCPFRKATDMKNLAVLGSTGSIGTQTIEVVRSYPDRFKVVAIAAGRNVELLASQCEVLRPQLVYVAGEREAALLREHLKRANVSPEICWGAETLVDIATMPGLDVVVAATTGIVSLKPVVEALKRGKRVALANKETLVSAGHLVMEARRRGGGELLPVDSEHSAIFQCLDKGPEGDPSRYVHRIILTASGGPFLDRDVTELEDVRPEEALDHPRWRMGRKISIDSATLMNKGLEVIEAHWLFGVDYDGISVVIHPESVVHSLVEFDDGSLLAQLGPTDMRLPILYALTYPERTQNVFGRLELEEIGQLNFRKVDLDRFPCLRLAYEAGRESGTMPTVLNAANEVAVESFLGGRLSFGAIPRVIEHVMLKHVGLGNPSLEDVVEADSWARSEAQWFIQRLRR